MAITVDTLKFFTSERMTDHSDGGGQMTATAIVFGASNQIFDNLSDVDRAMGDASVRKIYGAVTSANTDKYLDAGVVVFRNPDDANVSVLMASTGSFYDERADIQTYIENYLVRGPRYAAFLYETQIAGARALTFFGRVEDEAPGVNTTLVLVEFTTPAQTTESYSQYVRIIRILLDEVQTFTTEQGTFDRRIITCELSEALRYTFHGHAINQYDNLDPLAMIYSTVVADAARYYSVRPMTAEATTGDLSVYVDAIYDRIVPTSQVETPILDANAAAERTFPTAAAAGSISFTVGDTFNANFNLYVGRAIVPQSLSITVTGSSLTDSGGQLVSGTTVVGTVNYVSGIVTFAATSPTYSGSKTVTFIPAAPVTRATNSFGLPVQENTRFRTYVLSLKPPPNAGTLVVDYLSAGNWYRLQDYGAGLLSGAAESYGAGTVNLSTGSCSVTLGALPDVNSMIVFTYGSGADTRSLTGPETVKMTLDTGTPMIVRGTASLSWGGFTLTDQGNGTMTGTGGSATINYATGVLVLTPTTVPAASTEFDFACDQHTDASSYVESFTPTADGNGVISLTLAHSNIIESSLSVEYYAEALASDLPNADLLLLKWTTVFSNEAGGWSGHGGTVNAVAGTLTLDTDMSFGHHTTPNYQYLSRQVQVWNNITSRYDTQVVVEQAITSVNVETDVAGRLKAGSTVWARYAVANPPNAISKTLTGTVLSFSLKPQTGESLVSGGLRLTFGTRTYQDVAGRMIYDFNPATGTGTDAGSIDYASGQLALTDWPTVANSITLAARAVRLQRVPVTRAVFRTPTAPVAVGSFSFRVNLYGITTLLEGTADTNGAITGSVTDPRYGNATHVYGRFDYQTGVADVYFGLWLAAAGMESEPWYIEEAVNDSDQILSPRSVDLGTLLYNCVTYTSLPLDSSIIGLDPVRLPSDGRVPIFRKGQLVLVHHTDSLAEANLSPTQTIDCGRVRLYRVVIEDANAERLPASFYSVNRETGIVTMAADLNLTGYSGPYSIHHTVADLSVIADADLSGRLNLAKAVSHTYPADESLVSGVLFIGTLQARYSNLFAQSTWTSVWSDELIGSEPLAQYNDTAYPVTVSNLGAYPDRMLIKFTSSTAFQCFGENLGLIGTGNINEDFAPANLLTGQPYFTLDYRGWGAGWATGNCVRFNLIGANYPIDLIRAVQPSNPTGFDDSIELLLIGNGTPNAQYDG